MLDHIEHTPIFRYWLCDWCNGHLVATLDKLHLDHNHIGHSTIGHSTIDSLTLDLLASEKMLVGESTDALYTPFPVMAPTTPEEQVVASALGHLVRACTSLTVLELGSNALVDLHLASLCAAVRAKEAFSTIGGGRTARLDLMLNHYTLDGLHALQHACAEHGAVRCPG